MYSEKDFLTGITENIILGQLGPFGSGCFGLTIDARIIETYATQASGFNGIFDRMEMDDTPMLEQEHGGSAMMMTPMVAYTPGQELMKATGDAMMTPALSGMQSQLGFSPAIMDPNAQNNYASPGIGSPSPYYASPAYGSLRVGSGQYASPIYQQSMALMSGQYGPQSPIYQMSRGHASGNKQSGQYVSPIYKQEPGAPQVAAYSPAYAHVPGSVVSPAYGAANPGGSSHINSGSKHATYVSPVYSPSACVQSPAYTSQVSGSAMKNRQQYSAYSPAYSPAAMSGSGSVSKMGQPDSSVAGSSFGVQAEHSGSILPVQSPVYQPPSLAGHMGSASGSKVVQSPQYVAHSGVIGAPGGDIV